MPTIVGILTFIRRVNTTSECLFFVLFDFILYVPSTIFQLNRDGSSWVEQVLSRDTYVLLKDHNAVTPVRLEPAAFPSRVKHSTTEPLHSLSHLSVSKQEQSVFFRVLVFLRAVEILCSAELSMKKVL